MSRIKVLVIDDERLLRRSMCKALEGEGCLASGAGSVAEGRALFERERPAVVVLDVRLPDGSGLELLPQLRRIDPAVQVIIVTAFGETADAVQAMKLGAADFLKKPFDLQELHHAVQTAAKSLKREQQLKVYRKRERVRYARSRMIGECPAMQAVRELVRKVATSNTTTVLVTGESGTGKELVARAIHFQSARRDRPLMEINCSTFQESLLANELFGHEKGAFTGASYLKRGLVELCDEGTLFLDEVSEMPSRVQAMLLRFIDDQSFRRVGGNVDLSVDIRLIAATNANLEQQVGAERFRRDLFYRLKVVSVHLPPLRERGEDILRLAEAFLGRFSQEFRKEFRGITPAAAEQLRRYAWPGNVRELENLLERIVLLEDGPHLELRHLPAEIQAGGARVAEPGAPAGSLTSLLTRVRERLEESGKELPSLRDVEDAYISVMLDTFDGNRSRAARALSVSRQGLLDRLRKIEEQGGAVREVKIVSGR